MYKIGDQVRIIQRKKDNKTGVKEGWNKPNGNVGDVGFIGGDYSEGMGWFKLKGFDDVYLGIFDIDDVELISQEINYEIY